MKFYGGIRMKKEKEKKELSNNYSKEESLAEKVIDLCLWYQIEDSYNMIKIFESEIKVLEMQKEMILNNCTFKFQRKKFEKELEEIDKRIYRLYENVGEEVTLIERMKGAIAGKKDDENKSDGKANDLMSYYDLLSYLKHGIIFKKVSLNEFNKEIFYVYDNEGNYVIEDKTKVGNQFTTYLGEFDSDNNKFKKNIKIIEK
jgi:hypothetical protein